MFGSSNSGGGGFSFGSSNSNSSNNAGGSTGFSFGNNNNSTGTANTSTNSGGLFGSKPSTGFSFGSANTGTNSASTSGGGLFGNQSNNTNATGSTGLFGNTNNNNNSNSAAGNTGGGLFGNSNTNTTNTSAGGGLFGNTNNSSGGGLFGNSNNQANQANQTNSNTGGGLFGNTANTSNNSSSLFGNKPATGSTTGGLFGNNNATSNTNTSGGLFGNSGTSANTNTSSGGGLFGSTANKPTTGGGLFGNNNAASSAGNSLFGNSNNTSTNPSSTSGGLFGGNNNANSQNQQIGGGLFGTNNNQSTNNQPSFAWTQNQNSGFNTQSSLQNNPTINALQLRQQQEKQQQNLSNYSNTIIEQLMKIKNSWDPNSPASLLNTYFYNKVPESEVLSYVKPPNVSQEEWNNAISKRPGSTFVPVKASGFEDLKKRSEAQTNHVAQSRYILKEIEAKAKDLGDKHDLDSTTRITKCKNKHEQLSKKLLVLGCKLSILKSKGYPLSPEEEILSENFNKLLKLINDPIGLGRINELWSRLSILKERSELLKARLGNALYVGQKADGSGDDLNDVYNENEAQINKVIKILQKQQVGIQFLSEILEKDDATLDTLISEKQKK